MTTFYKYYFHIIDNEFNTEYDFEAYFKDHFESDIFITENEEAGNIITINAPFLEEVELTEKEMHRLWG
jgi:hypothetical protein